MEIGNKNLECNTDLSKQKVFKDYVGKGCNQDVYIKKRTFEVRRGRATKTYQSCSDKARMLANP